MGHHVVFFSEKLGQTQMAVLAIYTTTYSPQNTSCKYTVTGRPFEGSVLVVSYRKLGAD